MERIIIELKNKDKLQMLIGILNAIGIPFKKVENPSPSGDKWFLEKGNVEIIEKGIKELQSGKTTPIKDVQNIWESIL